MDFAPLQEGRLDLVFGPMFSGKTTEILRRIMIFAEFGMKSVIVNHNVDTREEGEKISTHNEAVNINFSKVAVIKANSLREIWDKLIEYNVIAIDEAQFYPNLKEDVMRLVDEEKKQVIVSGLNGDFNRQKFGEIVDLIPVCDTVTKLFPFCKTCMQQDQVLSRALFSKRLVKNDEIVLVGNESLYIPVCRKCYDK